MKKRVYGRYLSQATKSRKALLRSLVRALVIYGKIETTNAKAKSVQPLVDKLVNLAKGGGLSARRKVYALLGNDRKVADEISKIVKTNFLKRTGGYTRIIKLPERRGDLSSLVRLEWAEEMSVGDKGKEKSDKSTKKLEKRGRTKKEERAKKKDK